MRKLLSYFLTVALASSFATGAQAQEGDSRWQLRVMDLKQRVKIDATIRLADGTPAGSCMSGVWKRVIVESKSLQDEKFFPLAEPLAFETKKDQLTLGRATICDAYLFLSGKPDGSQVNGAY